MTKATPRNPGAGPRPMSLRPKVGRALPGPTRSLALSRSRVEGQPCEPCTEGGHPPRPHTLVSRNGAERLAGTLGDRGRPRVSSGGSARQPDRRAALRRGRVLDHQGARGRRRFRPGRLLGGHSLRVGIATSAAASGVSSRKIRQQTSHASDAMLARYIRDGELFVDNAAGALL